MLVITRKPNESIIIGDDIELIIVDVVGDKVKLAINAPKSVKILRKELIIETSNINQVANQTLSPSTFGQLAKALKNSETP